MLSTGGINKCANVAEEFQVYDQSVIKLSVKESPRIAFLTYFKAPCSIKTEFHK